MAPMALIVLATPLTACGGPVEVDVPDLDASAEAVCEAFGEALPDTLAEQDRVETEPAEAAVAAYGDPAIVVTCGATTPAEFDTAGSCELVNGVGWWAPPEQFADEDLDLTLYSAGYDPTVEILVPADLKANGGAAAMAVLSPLVEEHTTLVDVCD